MVVLAFSNFWDTFVNYSTSGNRPNCNSCPAMVTWSIGINTFYKCRWLLLSLWRFHSQIWDILLFERSGLLHMLSPTCENVYLLNCTDKRTVLWHSDTRVKCEIKSLWSHISHTVKTMETVGTKMGSIHIVLLLLSDLVCFNYEFFSTVMRIPWGKYIVIAMCLSGSQSYQSRDY